MKLSRSLEKMNPYKPKKVKVMDVRDETPDVKFIRLKANIKHRPGQFLEASILGYGEVPLGITSLSKRYVDLYVRNVGTTTDALFKLNKGDEVFVRGPYGNGFPVQEMYKKNIIIIGGGTGVVPLKSAIEYIKHHKLKFGDVNVYFGFRDYDNIMFKNEFKELGKRFNLNVTLDKNDKRWKGNVGLVTKLLEKSEIKSGAVALLCGPPVMIKFVIDVLHSKGLKDENIYVSFERMMSCGIGKCGHCMIKHVYVCKDGPVFRYDFAKDLVD